MFLHTIHGRQLIFDRSPAGLQWPGLGHVQATAVEGSEAGRGLLGADGTCSLSEIALQSRQEKVAICEKLLSCRSLLWCRRAGRKRGETGRNLGAREVWLENLEEEEKKRRGRGGKHKRMTLI